MSEVRNFEIENLDPVKGMRFQMQWWDGSKHEYEVISVVGDCVYYAEVVNGKMSKVKEFSRVDRFKKLALKMSEEWTNDIRVLFETKEFSEKHGVIRLEQWPEGIVLWVGGELVYKS